MSTLRDVQARSGLQLLNEGRDPPPGDVAAVEVDEVDSVDVLQVSLDGPAVLREERNEA